jgi:hypothetical protein
VPAVSVDMGHTTRTAIVAAVSLAVAVPLSAQEHVGTAAPQTGSVPPGWTFTPAFGYGGTYDDNISLFGLETAAEQNDDFISTYRPSVDFSYAGRHTRLGVDYAGSLLSYRTFTALNRWDQRAKFEMRRQETARVKWSLRAAGALMPSTELIELGGIPYSHTGARTADGRAGMAVQLTARDEIATSMNFLGVDFDRRPGNRLILLGGYILESLTSWRHKFGPRLAVGTDYSFRRAAVSGDLERFRLHSTEGGIDFELSQLWTFSGRAGVVYLESTPTRPANTGPAWRLSLDRQRGGSSFHVGYTRSFIPSFGFGGTIRSQEAGVSFRTPLFGSRRLYTGQSAVFRDDQPLTSTIEQLSLRSLRTNSVIGWEPHEWVRLEAFYARVHQTTLRAGGQVYRNRVGFQIVTSKPMRMW